MTTMIEVENLSKVYGETQAIKDVSFSVPKGSILGFLGPNGAGKTTTMRILTGYIPANEGTAKIDGFEVHDQPMAVRERIGYLPETPPLYPDMTVSEFLHFVCKIKGISAGDRSQKVAQALQYCQIEDKSKTIIRKLSKGYRQRVGIAQAIVHEPPVIILDEPTVGLDPRQIIEVRNLIKSLAGERTIILSTHILPEVSMTCDRVIIINQGSIVATGNPQDLLNDLKDSQGYELEIAGDTTPLNEILTTITGVNKVVIEPHKDEQKSDRFMLNISIDSNLDIGNLIASTLVNNNIDIFEMKRSKASLEEVFLQLTIDNDSQVNE